MPTMSVAQLRTFIDSDLPDSALDILLDAAAEAIAGVVGNTGTTTEYHVGSKLRRITTSRLVSAVTTITEDDVVLATNDYRVSGYVITRLDDGTNPRTYWGDDVVLVYVSVDDSTDRQRVQLDLVKLDLAQSPGVTQQTIGTFSESFGPGARYEEQRADILASLTTPAGGMRVVGD